MKKQAVTTPGPAVLEKKRHFQHIIQKMMDDKDAVNRFLDGEISGEQLHARGIKFIKAL
ncbi:hypothetical protein [Dyadobacter jiangsuensis]|uniref:hypothetical protein n=1 Tax=Dyadobacter jiangsuensis TaxID=1591085 RepID=UPI001474285C|nr:hypothetical protein [Dyadobacter jiangsuensis]